MKSNHNTSQPKNITSKGSLEMSILEILKDDPIFQEIFSEIQQTTEVTREAELIGDLVSFLDSLCDTGLESTEVAEFDNLWEEFINKSIALATKQFSKAGIPKDKIGRLIVYGWACFDQEFGSFHFRFGPPLDGRKAVPVILVFRDATWYPPESIAKALWKHPTFRGAVGEAMQMNQKEQVMRRIEWGASLTDEGYSSQRLRELASAMSNMLHVPKPADSSEDGWISIAIESRRFWAILAHAVDFGVHQNARRLFLDGKLQGAAHNSALNAKAKDLSWYLIIEEAVRESFMRTGEIPSPSGLRRSFGLDDAPGSDEVVLEFRDPRFFRHGKIKWGAFKKYAKQAGKIWFDHRTQ